MTIRDYSTWILDNTVQLLFANFKETKYVRQFDPEAREMTTIRIILHEIFT